MLDDAWSFTFAGPPSSVSRGKGAVLKVTPAGDDESDHEADALALWHGDGAVRLLARDGGRRALLIERAAPGIDASTLPDAEATAVAIEVGRRLWRPAGAPFRPIEAHVRRWLDDAERAHGDGSELVPLARRLLAELRPRQDVVVHGDFHHHNILRHGDRFVAIDSKAMLGDPEYDIPSFLRNPLGTKLPLERTLARLAAFEVAGLDRRRMCAWTAIRCAYLGADAAEVATIRTLNG